MKDNIIVSKKEKYPYIMVENTKWICEYPYLTYGSRFFHPNTKISILIRNHHPFPEYRLFCDYFNIEQHLVSSNFIDATKEAIDRIKSKFNEFQKEIDKL